MIRIKTRSAPVRGRSGRRRATARCYSSNRRRNVSEILFSRLVLPIAATSPYSLSQSRRALIKGVRDFANGRHGLLEPHGVMTRVIASATRRANGEATCGSQCGSIRLRMLLFIDFILARPVAPIKPRTEHRQKLQKCCIF